MNRTANMTDRPGKRARTRAALIEAAGQVISERGYDRTSLEAVAERAGMSRGAIYGNFQDKEELFLELIKRYWQPIVPDFQPGASFKEQMRIMGLAVARSARERLPRAGAAASFQLYVLTNEKMKLRIEKANEQLYRAAAQYLTRIIPAKQLPVPPKQFVRILDALTTGLLFTYFQTPALISEDDFIAAFQALA